jgi:hypothetical protein
VPEVELIVGTEPTASGLSDEDLMAEGATALPDKEVASVLDLNAHLNLGISAAAPTPGPDSPSPAPTGTAAPAP